MHFTDAVMLGVYCAESYQLHGRPLADLLVERARQGGLAGATVLRALAGFGPQHRLHSSKLLDLSHDLPLVIQLIDTKERIEDFIKQEHELLDPCTLVLSEVQWALPQPA